MKKIRYWLIALFLLSQGYAAAAQTLEGVDVVSGKPVYLQQYKNQTVLLAFFSAGCDACVYNFKLIREFYKSNKKSHFAVIGIGLDKKPEHFKNYAQLVDATTPKDEQFPLVWRNAPDYKDSFGTIKRDPSVVVIGKNGEVTLKREGIIQDSDWDDIWTSLQ
jgi:peroxiredoxin